jgi:hypothetical protein
MVRCPFVYVLPSTPKHSQTEEDLRAKNIPLDSPTACRSASLWRPRLLLLAELSRRNRVKKNGPASAKTGNEPLKSRVGLISPMIAHRRGLSLFEIEPSDRKIRKPSNPVELSSDAPSF